MTRKSPLAVRKASSNLALVCNKGDFTWHQLAQHVGGIQLQLEEKGFVKGDVLLAITPHSSFELILVYLACIEQGVTCALVPELPTPELDKRIQTSGAKAVFLCPNTSLTLDGALEIDFALEQGLETQNYSEQNLTSLIFTSGSTGEPKAVAHSVHNHLSSASGIQGALEFDTSSRWLLSLPMFHVSGLAIVWRWLFSGCALKLKQGKALELDGITHTSMVPTQLQRALDSGSLGDLKTVLLGGVIIPHQLAIEAARFGVRTWAGYGMTEMASTVTAKQVNEIDSVGTVLPNRELKLEQNRIWVRGDTLAQGYWQRGELTPLTLKDGWFDTKDLGYWIGSELCIAGRADNMFISGGENIHCEEIERVLLSHPDIEQAFIIPVEDVTFGHRPVAMILGPDELNQELKQELQNHCARTLQRFKLPQDYHLIPSQFLSQGIKVSRKKLAEYLDDL
ncbi:O-succinylbenzoic acid-CoA ligase [Vibrio sp. JCM 19236]|nr:O-succinylbenzoic acid-CoA ligase [Vibrio sp. JCM 19236]